MAQLPPTKRFSIEEFKDQKAWIERLIGPLNDFMLNVVSALTNDLTLSENLSAQLATVKVQTKTALTPGESFATTTFKTFVDADVNTGTEVITISSHGFSTGDRVQLSNTDGTLPGGISVLTDYFVIKTAANTLKLAASLSDAFAGTAINISSAAGGGTHTLTLWTSLNAYADLFESARFTVRIKKKPVGLIVLSCVDTATNPIKNKYGVSADWAFKDGQVVIQHVSGLEPSKTYALNVAILGG